MDLEVELKCTEGSIDCGCQFSSSMHVVVECTGTMVAQEYACQYRLTLLVADRSSWRNRVA
jgi:hypothetical protein